MLARRKPLPPKKGLMHDIGVSRELAASRYREMGDDRRARDASRQACYASPGAMRTPHPAALLVLFAVTAAAQPAIVTEDGVKVFAGSTTDSFVRGTLAKDERVHVELRFGGGLAPWCSIVRVQPRLSGYVDCSKLQVVEPPASSAGAVVEPVYRLHTNSKIEELLRLSGAETMFRRSLDPRALAQALARNGNDPAAIRELLAIYAKTAQPDLFLDPIRARLANTYSDALANAALEWSASDAGRRTTAYELQVLATATPESFQRFAEQLAARPLTGRRAALLDRLWRSTDYSDFQVEVAVSVVRAVAEAVNPRLRPERRLTAQGLRKIEAEMASMKPLFQGISKTELAYLYRDLPEQDLISNILFCESPAGRWMLNGVQRGSLEGVRAFMIEFTKALDEREARLRRER